jgi:predicted nucleic acid-binding protein
MSEVFADSHYFIALLNRRDQSHASALQCSRRHGLNVVTTHWVLVEVADALSDPSLRQAAEQFILSLLSRNQERRCDRLRPTTVV